jgi:hypothetical protein
MLSQGCKSPGSIFYFSQEGLSKSAKAEGKETLADTDPKGDWRRKYGIFREKTSIFLSILHILW